MTNVTNLTRPGQVNNANAVDALFLKQFSGEVLAAFQQSQVTNGRFIERAITSGKSATFPLLGRTSASLHTPGVFIDAGATAVNERVIPIDGKLIAPNQYSDLEDLQNHYDIRSVLADEMGEAIANQNDANNLRCAILGSRSTAALVTGEPGGEEITDANADDTTANLVDAIATSHTKMTEKRVPKANRATYLRPVQYALIQRSTLVTDRDLGGVGSFAMGTTGPIQGVEIVETINLPNTDESADTDVIAKYRANYSTVVAVSAHSSAVGVVNLMQMAMEITWDSRRQVWFMLAKKATGHDFLRNSAAISIKTA